MEEKIGKTLWDFLLSVQKAIMIITSIMVTALIFSGAVMRYVFKTDFYGLEEIILFVAFWLYFIGSSYGSYEKSQISADIVSVYIKNEKHKKLMRVITSFFTAGLSIMVCYWSIQFIAWSFKMNPVSPVFRLPMVIPQSSIAIGFILMTFYSIVYFYQDIKDYLEARKK